VEPDPGARSAAENGLFILAGSAELLPDQLPLASFDLVVMSHVLEHCLDPVTALTNVRRLLKPGGLALLSVPNNECIGESLSGMAWRWMDLPRHVNFFTGTSLARLCQACGLAVESTDYDGYFRQFDNEWLEEERRIRADLGIPGHPSPWTLLGKTFFAPDRLKYDSVSVTARKALEA
jgi:SAM-dependent methyltransferase